jgi:hypothetical protein
MAKVIALLKKHPQYDQLFAPKINDENLSAAEKDLYLFMLAACWFMLAACWPDVIKGTNYEPKHYNWHYINYPYVALAGSNIVVTQPDTVNIVTAYLENVQVLKSKSATDAEKAIALCWVFHLIGDVHQPLHTSKLFSEALPAPDGDRGGNLLFIKADEEGKPVNLHSFWDGLILGSQDLREADNRAILLKNQEAYSRKSLKGLKNKHFENWARNESFSIAQKYAYQEGKIQASTKREEAPIVFKEYITMAKAIAEKQIVLAGYRIADQLQIIF